MNTLLYSLLLAHILGDFVFQPNHWVRDKEQNKHRSKSLYKHTILHILLTFLLTMSIKYWAGILVIGITHYIIDLWKISNQNTSNKRSLFFIDQTLHIGVIIAVAEYYHPFILQIFQNSNIANIYSLIITVLLLTQVSSTVIKILISKWTPETNSSEPLSLDKAGKFIGMIERLLIFLFISINQFSAVGFLLAAKSVFRFGDLKETNDRQLTEYILIGTLLSFGLAIIVSLAYHQIEVN